MISVIIPVYNRHDVLIRAVNSVFKQSYKNFELIVVDDGSDNPISEEILFANRPVEIKYKYIKLNSNSGVSRARNIGVKESIGKWIAFLDSDDEWLPKKLELQMSWISQNPTSQICQTKEIWFRKGVRVNPPKGYEKVAGNIFSESLKKCMITPSSVMLSRKLFDKYNGFNESFLACEDYDLWLKITRTEKIGLIDKQLLIRYGGNNDQLSFRIKVLDKYRVESVINLLEENNLTKSQRNEVKKNLIKRAKILAKGYLKRGKIKEYDFIKGAITKYEK